MAAEATDVADRGGLLDPAGVARAAGLRRDLRLLGKGTSEVENVAIERRCRRLANELRGDVAAVEAKLRRGWDWLERHPEDRANEDRWIGWLRVYEDLVRLVRQGERLLP